MKGERILPRIARKTDIGTLCLDSCLWITAPTSNFVFWCGHSRFSGVATPETAMGVTMKLPRGYLTIFTQRDAIISLVRS